METIQNRNCVLDKDAIQRKMKRMALQIAEENSDEKELIIAGIAGNGAIVAKCLLDDLTKLASFKTSFVQIVLNKKEPLEVALEPGIDVTNKVVILVDDVSNTGKTLLYALKPFLAAQPKKIQT